MQRMQENRLKNLSKIKHAYKLSLNIFSYI